MGGVFSSPSPAPTPAPPPAPAPVQQESIQDITKRRKAAEGRATGTATGIDGPANFATKKLLGQ